eukprot:2141096-Rhodomonas_salina.1
MPIRNRQRLPMLVHLRQPGSGSVRAQAPATLAERQGCYRNVRVGEACTCCGCWSRIGRC